MRASPLAGVRVVALEQAVAAPLCSRHLADLGAEVIKVERPGRGDFARDYDAYVLGESAHFVWLNGGKKSLALDLKTAEGRDVLVRLLRDADVLVSNLGPGALERIVPDEELVALNPRLVRCAISGYGPSGPYQYRKAFDLLVQGEAGVTASTGEVGHPAKPGVSLADVGAGIYAAAGILAALFRRERSGVGDRVEIAMFDVMVEWMSPLLLTYREAGIEIEPAGTRHATITPYGPFGTVDGRTINIAVQNTRQWLDLCDVLGLDDLAARVDLCENAGRLAQRDLVERAVAEATGHRALSDLADRLEEAGIPWGTLNSIADVSRHPQLNDTVRWRTAVLPSEAEVTVLDSPFHPEGRSGENRVPALGEDSTDVLARLGYAPDDIERLLRDGTVAAAVAGGTT